jgi:hypothetical protein
MPVTWELQYVNRTETERAVWRHHFQSFLGDANVERVSLASPDHLPPVIHVIVVFREGLDQPETYELRHMDRRFPVRTDTHDNVVPALQPSSVPPVVSLPEVPMLPAFTLPAINVADLEGRFRELSQALRVTGISVDPAYIHDAFTPPELTPSVVEPTVPERPTAWQIILRDDE